jgi:hypothetical protein
VAAAVVVVTGVVVTGLVVGMGVKGL